MHLPCRLRELRGRRPISEIEQSSGVHRGTLSLLERGRMLPTEKQIEPLEQAYGHPVHDWYPPAVLVVIARDLEQDAA